VLMIIARTFRVDLHSRVASPAFQGKVPKLSRGYEASVGLRDWDVSSGSAADVLSQHAIIAQGRLWRGRPPSTRPGAAHVTRLVDGGAPRSVHEA
jgi:hypothetical protein